MVSVMHKPGVGLKCTLKSFRFTLMFLPALSLVACGSDPTQPDLATRESFARSVLAAAASGSVEQVEKLAPDDFINIRPDAQRLVDEVRGWDPASVTLRLSNDFPEIANVQALKPGGTVPVRYGISWGDGRWTLGIGTPRHPPTGGAKPGTPGDESDLKSNVRK
jgi:hypothetical protein